MAPIAALLRSLDTGLEDRTASAPPTVRVYTKVVHTCGDCHACCTGTQFVRSVCALTSKPVQPEAAPPDFCPLPGY